MVTFAAFAIPASTIVSLLSKPEIVPLNVEPVVLADEPVYADTYVSRCDIDPFGVPEQDKINFLPGLIDPQYRGELKVLLVNTDPTRGFSR